jgi:hypothetical protein
VAGEIDEIAGSDEDPLAASRYLDPDLGQRHFAMPPLDQVDFELLFEVPNLHRQRRLGDRAGVRCPAEMALLGKRMQIAQLAQGNHQQ